MGEIVINYVRASLGDVKAKEPAYATKGSAGMDLSACIDRDILVKPGEIVKVPTGIAIQIPDIGIAGFVFPRSGLSSKHGVSLANCVGVIDSDYTGEIICPVINHGKNDYIVKNGDRIAQIVFMPVFTAAFREVSELAETERGSGGFGSTGK
ncbi:MAG: dUTP diphosphatase [Caulobacteraceae bacterium]